MEKIDKKIVIIVALVLVGLVIKSIRDSNTDVYENKENINGFVPDEELTNKRKDVPQPSPSVPVQVWHECVNCLGSGQCPYCFGQDRCIDQYGEHSCPVCTGGRCNVCAGQGGHYEIEYR